ncbi:hypothetical protein C7453_101598 [Gluconacetobacter liquefaciens]|uniref:Uncharacterized protein n=1 Tax=Gluconacetobacter liquefaciens TaxID=89584 RepID=A0A370GCK0_GLULI|nr:hypothetical protein C7453_101598 [Gluconacetobacter liquefaciens]
MMRRDAWQKCLVPLGLAATLYLPVLAGVSTKTLS